MTDQIRPDGPWEVERYELRAAPVHQFAANRREFVQVVSAGLAVAVTVTSAQAQRRGGRGRGGDGPPVKLTQRFQLDADGSVTVFTSKVEVGQGSRTQLTQAAAEELQLPLDRIRLVMADTQLCPDDGGTAGSRTTPASVPSVRRGAAALREFLAQQAAERLGIDRDKIVVVDGVYSDPASQRKLTFGELVADEGFAAKLAEAPATGEIRKVSEWKVLGTSVKKTTGRDVVTGAHKYPSDIQLPDMQYGKVLNPPSFGAKLLSIDLSPAEAMEGVKAVRDGEFVGCVAPTSWQAKKAVEAIAATAKWEEKPQVSSEELFEHFKKTATEGGSGWGGPQVREWGDPAAKWGEGGNELDVTYTVPYIQHAPMEPRAAVAEWKDDKLTVWTGSQQPGRVVGELKQVFRLNDDQVRVIVPDTGGGFGGKHSGEVAIEAARLAKAAGKPVSVRWTREEEFTWAYFRPAGLMVVSAGLLGSELISWYFTNFNSGGSALDTPYKITRGRVRFMPADSPLRQGSYRALASTANTFARECAMDELAVRAGMGPLEFRMKHLEDGRLKDVLLAATEKFRWQDGRSTQNKDNRGMGLACGTEKGSFVAACAEVEVVDREIKVLSVTQAFECGAIQNPGNLRAQVEGCLVMGLGGALTEEIKFKDGKITNARFSEYAVPRMADVPELDIVLVDRPDLPSLGAGETPIIAIAPAIANAVFDAVSIRLRSLPLRIT
jgi:CO/xanthine dehydrogenase Mo-binding subunit